MKKISCFFLFLLLIISACHKNNTSPSVFTSTSYPLAVGDWWEYQLTSIGNEPDTIMLSVTSMTNIGPYTQYTCNYLYHGVVTGPGYFQQSDTSLSFFNTPPYIDLSPIQNFHLKFPASKGDYWAGAFKGDSITVTGVVSSYTAYGHTYGPCYYLGEAYNLPHNSKVESMILTPKIGLIYQSINFTSDTAEGGLQVKQSINLIDYHVQ